MVVGATLFTRGTVALMGRVGGETIHALHTSAEYLVEHHSVPPAWQEKLRRRHGRSASPGDAAKRASLRQLDKIIAHFTKTSLVEDEEARGILLRELEAVYEEWLAASWAEMCSPRGEP